MEDEELNNLPPEEEEEDTGEEEEDDSGQDDQRHSNDHRPRKKKEKKQKKQEKPKKEGPEPEPTKPGTQPEPKPQPAPKTPKPPGVQGAEQTEKLGSEGLKAGAEAAKLGAQTVTTAGQGGATADQTTKAIAGTTEAGIATGTVGTIGTATVIEDAVVAGAAVEATPVGWVATLVVLLIIVAVALFLIIYWLSTEGKISSLNGSTIKLGMHDNNTDDNELVKHVLALSEGDNPKILIPQEIKTDLDWQIDPEGGKTHMLDWRVLKTMEYLAGKWEVIGVGILQSNGPDETQRVEVAGGNKSVLNTFSAYAKGQGLGIDKIGLTSQELADKCFGGKRVPVEVGWQKVTKETFIRPTYEQLGEDAGILYKEGNVITDPSINVKKADSTHRLMFVDAAAGKDAYMVAEEKLTLLTANLNLVVENGSAPGLGVDKRTAQYAQRALDDFQTVLDNVKKAEGEGYIKEWMKAETKAKLDDGVRFTFRAMQVANMTGWRTGSCDYRKAYEARQNIRQLAAQILAMPTELAGEKNTVKFNKSLIVKQLIVYSPEDNLDDGLPRLDVFPNGGIVVDEGGIAFKGVKGTGDKLQVGDGKIDYRDSHLTALPVDNGIFSKASTIFLFDEKRPNVQALIAKYQAMKLDANLSEYYNSWDGPMEPVEGYQAARVSYKNFVHIGF